MIKSIEDVYLKENGSYSKYKIHDELYMSYNKK